MPIAVFAVAYFIELILLNGMDPLLVQNQFCLVACLAPAFAVARSVHGSMAGACSKAARALGSRSDNWIARL